MRPFLPVLIRVSGSGLSPDCAHNWAYDNPWLMFCIRCCSVRETIDFAARVQGTGVRVQELQRVRPLSRVHDIKYWCQTFVELQWLLINQQFCQSNMHSATASWSLGAGHHRAARRGVRDAEGGQEWQRRGAIRLGD